MPVSALGCSPWASLALFTSLTPAAAPGLTWRTLLIFVERMRQQGANETNGSALHRSQSLLIKCEAGPRWSLASAHRAANSRESLGLELTWGWLLALLHGKHLCFLSLSFPFCDLGTCQGGLSEVKGIRTKHSTCQSWGRRLF